MVGEPLHEDLDILFRLSQEKQYVGYVSVSLSVLDNFSASDWLKVGDAKRRCQTSYYVARLLLMVPIEPWRNSTQFFGAVAFCTTKIDDLKTTCPCRSHIQRLHYPAFAAFF